jgi:hypothetical protein
LRDDDERGRGARLNEVADIDEAEPGNAVDRRGDRRILDVQLGGVDLRLVGLHRRRQLIDGGFLRIVLLPGRREPSRQQRSVAREITLRIFKIGLIFCPVRLGLLKLRLVRAWVNLHEQIAGMDKLAPGVGNPDDIAIDRALDGDCIERTDRADAAHNDRNILASAVVASTGTAGCW